MLSAKTRQWRKASKLACVTRQGNIPFSSDLLVVTTRCLRAMKEPVMQQRVESTRLSRKISCCSVTKIDSYCNDFIKWSLAKTPPMMASRARRPAKYEYLPSVWVSSRMNQMESMVTPTPIGKDSCPLRFDSFDSPASLIAGAIEIQKSWHVRHVRHVLVAKLGFDTRAKIKQTCQTFQQKLTLSTSRLP